MYNYSLRVLYGTSKVYASRVGSSTTMVQLDLYLAADDEFFTAVDVQLAQTSDGAHPLVVCSLAVTTNKAVHHVFSASHTCPSPSGTPVHLEFPNGLAFVSSNYSNTYLDSLTFWSPC